MVKMYVNQYNKKEKNNNHKMTNQIRTNHQLWEV